jgi:hypothetical protein
MSVDAAFGDDTSPVINEPEAVDVTTSGLDDETGGDEVEAAADESDGQSPEAIAGEEAEEAEPATPAAPKGKQVAFKVGDTEVPLDENAKFTWKVDGKQEDITLKDLIANYAGKIPVEKRFAELDKARQQEAKRVQEFEGTKTRHSAAISAMHKNVTEGKIFEAIAGMLELSGSKADPRQFVKTMRGELIKQAQTIAQMSPEQLAMHEKDEEFSYLKSQHDRLVQQRDQESAQLAHRERVNGAMQSVDATLEQYTNTKTFLEKAYKERGWDEKTLTPEAIAQHFGKVRTYEETKAILTRVDPELVKNDKLWDEVTEMKLRNPTWSDKDIEDVVRAGVSQKRSTAVSKKVAKSPVATVATAAVKAKPVLAKAKKAQDAALKQDPSAWSYDNDTRDW